MADNLEVALADESATVAFGLALGRVLKGGVVFLEGGLGAGKTTLCRGILRSRGFAGAVKSPTYTLVEPYHLGGGDLFHFDLYRLKDPEELEYMGVRDYFRPDNLCLVEWPEMGEGLLPEPDIVIRLTPASGGRKLIAIAVSSAGKHALSDLAKSIDGVENN